MNIASASRPEPWPSLDLEAWKDTCATLHLWTQIVGKIRLAQSPWVNHSWHVTLTSPPEGLPLRPFLMTREPSKSTSTSSVMS